MTTSFKETLENLRKEIISQKNAEYHERMKSIVDKAIQTIDINEMKQSFIDQIKSHPHSNGVSTQWEFSLDSLFIDEHIWTTDNKRLLNPIKPLELYFHYKKNYILYACSKQRSCKTQEFYDYLYTTDPDIQRLKNIFKKAFPDATIRPWINIQHDMKATMRIEVSYKFDSDNEHFEKVMSEPYRNHCGDFVLW